jgi:transcriptional regulator with XRE-family HTH domain
MTEEQKEYLEKLGTYVVRLRQEQSLKQYELADTLDIDVRVMRRIEKGKMNIQILFLFKLAQALKVAPKELIELSDVD